MSAYLRIEFSVAQQRKQIVTAANQRNAVDGAVGRPTPALERDGDASRPASGSTAAQYPGLGKLIQRVDHLPEKLALSTQTRNGIRSVTNQCVLRARRHGVRRRAAIALRGGAGRQI